MILGFLRSASGFLVKGAQPLRGQKGKVREGGDDTEVDSDQECELSGQTDPTGGAVIITLRNVPPYTECKVCPSYVGGPTDDSHSRGHLSSR